jgi:hypothetical protein
MNLLLGHFSFQKAGLLSPEQETTKSPDYSDDLAFRKRSGLQRVAVFRWWQWRLAQLTLDPGPSYELIDSNLLAGNPVIALIPLPDGGYHFVVIVGKEGRDYLIRDPAASPFRRAYHLRDLTDRIAGLCFFRTI